MNCFKSFALGNQKFSTLALVATIVVSYISGSSIIVTINNIYKGNLYIFFTKFSSYIAILVLGFVIIPRLQSFSGSISIAEAIGKIYGKWVRRIVSLTIIMSGICMITIQFKAFFNIFTLITNTDVKIYTAVSILLVIICSSLWGIKIIIYRDIVALFVFCLSMILISLIIIYSADISSEKLLQLGESEQFNFKKIFNIDDPVQNIMHLNLVLFLKTLVNPVVMHRTLIESDLTKLKKVMIISAIILICIEIIISIIPISLFIINPKLDPNLLIAEIVKKYSHITIVSTGLVLSVIMISTYTSHINTSAITFANDLCSCKNPKTQLFIARFFSIFLVLTALILSFISNNLFMIIIYIAKLYLVVSSPVILLTILGFRTKKAIILISMGLGLFTIIKEPHFYGFVKPVAAIAVTTLSIIVLHYLTHVKKTVSVKTVSTKTEPLKTEPVIETKSEDHLNSLRNERMKQEEKLKEKMRPTHKNPS
ncbi:SLC5/6 family protein [Rickettsia endosymbiont of Cardiosporidium cionae]|uniref:hypothetical protein n=1 Tax=Rickettsia endosymbiont of Cardiosporidium cionae TaxID=2777155 RepID=UPI001895733F|nr:hypothetical protein [Rickettsia endosymbiont of Cardiosporidium cionae]KAF8818560.1 hypothetical protein IHI24_000277 [Rickettsia endosymbiont of Cardiosporidium cionae]